MSKAIGSLLRYKKFQTFKEESVNTTKHAVNTNKTIGNLKDVTEYTAVKKRYSTGLNKLMKGFTSGTISKDQASTQFQALAEKHFKEAFSSGQTFIGNPNVTEVHESLDAFLKKGAGTEAGFFKKFLNDLDKYPENADPDGVRKLMNFDKRKTMYEDTLDSMFVNGAITALPDDTPVWWELSPTCIHCPDCIDMSAANPWTVKTLPFIPRSGNTVCFLSGELEIHTIKGLKKLKDIQLNELVLTHKGRYKPVITRTQDLPKKDQFYSGKVYSFILSDDDKHILTPFCLPTHRYFDINADWVEAKNLQKYDYISTLILIDELVLYHEWVIETINIKEIKNKRIWSIGVKEDESFILANGVVSHNCLSKCCCNLRIGERDDAGEAPAGAIKASTKVPNRRDGSIPSVQVKEELNTLTSEMNYHRQMAEAIKKGRNYQDLAKDEKDLISFHLSKRKELNARIIELNADQRTKSIPQFSVKDLTGQVNEMQKQGYDLVYSPLETLAAGDDVAGLSNTLIDVGTVNVVDSATGSIGINSVSRGNIELLYERSLFYRKPVQKKVFTDYEKGVEFVEEIKNSSAVAMEQHLAITSYTNNRYKPINELLRTGSIASSNLTVEVTTKLIADVQETLTVLPSYKGFVYRGFSTNAPELQKYIDTNLPVGGVFIDKGFMSTSADIDRTLAFARNPADSVILTIRSKSGKLIEPFALSSSEHEVLFLPNSKFRILSNDKTKTFSSRTWRLIELEEI